MLSKTNFKIGFCVAYDWELLRKSVPRVYEWADTLVFSLDKHRRSWSGLPYAFDEAAFQQFLLEVDVEKKIQVYEDDFSLPELSPIENDNRQRNLMAQFMGQGGWHIQIDSDEYFLDFRGFTQYLKKLNPQPKPSQRPLNICCNWISLIKKTENGYLYVKPNTPLYETMPFATNRPDYHNARRNGHFNHLSPFFVLHETWARGEEELRRKINSWGHDDDFIDKESFFRLWQVLDDYNYRFIRNFHPLQGEVWPALDFCKGRNIEEFLDNFPPPHFPLSQFGLFLKNNRNMVRLRQLWSKLIKKR